MRKTAFCKGGWQAARALILGSLTTLLVAISPGNLTQPAVAKSQRYEQDAQAQIAEERVGDKLFQVSRIVVNTRPEAVYSVLTDYDNATRVFPNLKKCKVLEDKGSVKIVEHHVHPSGYPCAFEYVLEVKENAPRAVEWKRLRGDFKEVDGMWKIEPIDGGKHSLVTYFSHINGGLFIPQALIKRQVRIDIPPVMAALKNKAESSTQIARKVEPQRNN